MYISARPVSHSDRAELGGVDPAAVPVRRRRLRTPRPGHRLPLALRVLGPVPARAHHGSVHARLTPAPRQRRDHRRRIGPHAPSPSTRRWPQEELNNREGVRTFTWPPAGTATWPLTGGDLSVYLTMTGAALPRSRNCCRHGWGHHIVGPTRPPGLRTRRESRGPRPTTGRSKHFVAKASGWGWPVPRHKGRPRR
jgi:hypothetical protein